MNTSEASLILNRWVRQNDEATGIESNAKAVINGEFKTVLVDYKHLLRLKPFAADQPLELEKADVLSTEMLIVAVACLNAFVQANWTGPDLDFQPSEVITADNLEISSSESSPDEKLNIRAISDLAYAGEPAYQLTQVPCLLRVAQLLLGSDSTEDPVSARWWRMRAHSIHQRILDDTVPSDAHFDLGDDFARSLEGSQLWMSELRGRLHLELGLLHHMYAQDRPAYDAFVKAAEETGLQYEITGALGKKTKFQEKELSQLVLMARSTKLTDPRDENPENSASKPETLLLNDDTLLEETKFSEDQAQKEHLHPLDQSILLALCLNVQNTSPQHGLTHEQMSPYVARVVAKAANWSVHTMALLVRSRLERSRTRTVERATLQLQALVDQIRLTSDDDAAPVRERLELFHSLALPTKPSLQKELGLQFFSLGVVKSALEVFETLQMWEESINCYVALEESQRALDIVKAQLASPVATRDKARHAKLLCLLGDLDPDNAKSHYLEAWEVSKHGSARAMRSLGGYLFARAQYEEAFSYLQEAVRIQPLHHKSSFILGCAAMRLERWDEARQAFGRCVRIDEEDGESWSNLASMYLRLDAGDTFQNKLLAHRALKQGVKFNYENWKMWSNYMIVSVDVGEFSEAARALGRLTELSKGKMLDIEVVEHIVDAATRAPDASTESGRNEGLIRQMGNLFERTILPALSSESPDAIATTVRAQRAYAKLLTSQSRWSEALQAHLVAYHAAIGDVNTTEQWRDAVKELNDIVDMIGNFGPRIEETDGKKWKFQCKSLIRAFMGKYRADYEDEPEWDSLKAILEDLK